MKLLESVAVLSDDGVSIVEEGTQIKIFESPVGEPEYIDGYTEADLVDSGLPPQEDLGDPDPEMAELAQKVQRWIEKAGPAYEGKINPETWDAVTNEALQIAKMLSRGNREGVADRANDIKRAPSEDQAFNKIVGSLYAQITPKLGTFEIMKKSIGEDVDSLANFLIESLEASLRIINE